MAGTADPTTADTFLASVEFVERIAGDAAHTSSILKPVWTTVHGTLSKRLLTEVVREGQLALHQVNVILVNEECRDALQRDGLFSEFLEQYSE